MKNWLCADLGTGSLHLADMGRAGHQALEQMPDNLVWDGVVRSYEAMGNLLAESAKKNHFGRDAAVLLPAGKVYVRTLTLPRMSDAQLKLNLPFEFRDYIGEDKASYFFDYAVMAVNDGPDGKAPEMELLAAATQKATIASYVQMFKQAGMRLVMAAPEEMGYCALVRGYVEHTPEADRRAFCIVDLGHTATRFHMLNGARYAASRVIDTGIGAVDEAISKALDAEIHTAQDYKLNNYRDCLNLPDCHAAYERIAVEIMRAVNFYRYNNPDTLLDTLYLCGGGANIEPLVREIGTQNPDLRIAHVQELYPAGVTAGAGLTPAALGLAME